MPKKIVIKRIIVEVPIAIHDKVKSRSKLRGITMRLWMLRALLERLLKEENG